MFTNSDLQEHLETSSTIRINSLVLAEWNMNIANNIAYVGNYRYRPRTTGPYQYIAASFNPDEEDLANKFFTGATDADTVIDGGYDVGSTDTPIPIAFVSTNQKEKMLYSLEDCFGRFRPRSGINKLRFFDNGFSHHSHPEMARRPRYYMASREDPFKYWTSYRTEDNEERGVADELVGTENYIQDAAPFVVYKDPVPANRIVVKMQTHTGDIDLGPFVNENGEFNDPFYGLTNQSTPVRWKIQYLDGPNGNWTDAIAFNQNSVRDDGSPVVGPDGYLEIAYGLIVPSEYRSSFVYISDFAYAELLPAPEFLQNGTAYLVKENDTVQGTFYIAIDGEYQTFAAEYGWYIHEETVSRITNFVTDLTAPSTFVNTTNNQQQYRELQYVYGLRIVIDTMNKFDSTFDLIELSPRLAVNLTDKTVNFSITKVASDLGVSGMPVGQLLASTGSLDIFDYDRSFFIENEDSIVNKYTSQNIQLKFYEIVRNVEGFDYYIPIKTMYSEGFPAISNSDRMVTMTLRDLFFYFETITAPQLLIQNASLSYAISLLLDHVGFSNYVFKRVSDEELIIPFFAVGPDQSVAEVLNQLAVSAQAAMFFDEYNDFIIMSKDYMMPDPADRPVDITLRGSKDFAMTGAYQNAATGELVDAESVPQKRKLANIIDMASQDMAVYNDGQINYTTRYLQRSYGSLKQANVFLQDKTWIYKPVELWEVTGDATPRSENDQITNQSAYSLVAIPLNASLSNKVPSVQKNAVVDNIIDLGEGIQWMSRYNGYFFANGEIIRYDAVQYSIPGLTESNVWISSVQEYQNYFSKLPFNGKIYPTGLVRIYSEPEYETVNGILQLKNGPVIKHGRGQFGTPIVTHSAGISSHWTSNDNLRGVTMDTRYLFSSEYSQTTQPITDLAGFVFNDTIDRGEAVIAYDSPEYISCTMTSASEGSPLIITTTTKHGLVVNDVVYFRTTGTLPGLIVNQRYYVKALVGTDGLKFTVSATKGGTVVSPTLTQVSSQSGSHTFALIVEKSTKTATIQISPLPTTQAEVTITAHDLPIGTPLFFTTTGALPTGISAGIIYIVSSIKDANTIRLKTLDNVFVVTSGSQSGTHTANILAYPAKITTAGHRFLPGDEFKLDTTGVLPLPLSTSNTYYVSDTGFSASRFMFTDSLGTQKITVDDVQTGEHTLQSMLTEAQTLTKIVVPSTDRLAKGMYLERLSGTGSLQSNTRITDIDVEHKVITVSPAVSSKFVMNTINPGNGEVIQNSIRLFDYIPTVAGKAGLDNNGGKTSIRNYRARSTTRNGIIKNFLANVYLEESTVDRMTSAESGTVQSSALVMNGPDPTTNSQLDLLSYVYKTFDEPFVHFGTRMRIVGRITGDEQRGQSPSGVDTYYTATGSSVDKQISIGGASGGLAILLNPETNNGYYLEIAALTDTKLDDYENASSLHNVIFYKIERDQSAPNTPAGDGQQAIPVKLWGGEAKITVDDGQFVGQYRMAGEENPTVYDVAVEYETLGKKLRFYIYINNNLIATVDDDNPPMVIAQNSITSQNLNKNLAVVTISGTHSIKVGDTVNITGAYPVLNGRHVVSAITSNTITYPVENTAFEIIQRTVLDNEATIVTKTAHGLSDGDKITISGLTDADNDLNGEFTVINATSNTLVFALVGVNRDAGTPSGSGIVQYRITTSATTGTLSTIPNIAKYNGMALFIRGSSRAMFENIYALNRNYTQNTTFGVGTIVDTAFGDGEISAASSFQKYALSGILQSTYLSGIGSAEPPKYRTYFEEFGTIMREAAYFKIRYDQAYPALYAKISPTFNDIKGYTVSGFLAGAYGAEFLIFNHTDTVLNLDSTSGNYLRIQGITFTQQSTHELTVDEYFSRLSNLSDPEIAESVVISSPLQATQDYADIRFSRMTYGRKQFTIDAEYIQTQDEANKLMGWLSSKIMQPRKSIGIRIFGLPILQLGDIIDIDYATDSGTSYVPASQGGSRFVVYNIEYSGSPDGPSMTIYLSEVT